MRGLASIGTVAGFLGAAWIFCGAAEEAWADVVVPGAQAASEGDSNNSFPFNNGVIFPSMRYQQVYASSAFGGGSVLITAIRFRPDGEVGSAFGPTSYPGMLIRLSTTSAAVDGLSSTFASNLGGDVTTVFSGTLVLSSANSGPAGGPKAFDILITLTTPFTYNPASGNLLLDVLNPNASFSTSFDAQNDSGDAVSRALATSSGATTASLVDSSGLVTQFVTGSATVVPEPASLALFGLGALGLGGLALRRRRTAKGS